MSGSAVRHQYYNGETDDNDAGTTDPPQHQAMYYQMGAPALVYRERLDFDTSFVQVPGSKYTNTKPDKSSEQAKILHESIQRQNRVKTRWNFSVDLRSNIRTLTLPSRQKNPFKEVRKRNLLPYQYLATATTTESDHDNHVDGHTPNNILAATNDNEPRLRYNETILKSRLGMLLQHERDNVVKKYKTLKDYATFDQPYISADRRHYRKRDRAPRLDSKQSMISRKFALQRSQSIDPAYLAPMPHMALLEWGTAPTKKRRQHRYQAPANTNIDKVKIENFAPSRSLQGNALLCLPCPCPNCYRSSISQFKKEDEQEQLYDATTSATKQEDDGNLPPQKTNTSWCLFHPKGLLMDTLCVSNLILPNGSYENAGHVFTVSKWEQHASRRRERIRAIRQTYPNELCLDETIVEIQQSGTWDANHSECIFVARTSTHISVIQVTVQKPEFSDMEYSYSETTCWGNYTLQEVERIDLRSLVPSSPSYRPMGLACHPKYGNEFTNAKFAFVSLAEHSGQQNVIHHYNQQPSGSQGGPPDIHAIPSLRYISCIDFTSTQPMCLWSAAASYVRPALVPDFQFPNQPPLAFGTSLYTIDLRSNSATFQWSPSAEMMLTEGIHSINAVMTDWERDHIVWVNSRSAGRTWEIDGRMPCRAVNSWSLTMACEDDSITFPQRGLYGEPALLTKTREISKTNGGKRFTNPLFVVDTTPAAFGFHILQRPNQKPKFQTHSLECIATPNLDRIEGTSIVTSSIFPLPEHSDDVYICGMASLRTPIHTVVPRTSRLLSDIFSNNDDDDSSILCTLTMTNKGDLYCHSLLESQREVKICKSFPHLPVGARTIPLPKDLDGKSSYMEHKSWKPTGGMNLKLFLSNQYPAPYESVQYVKQSARKLVPLPRHVRKSHPSLRREGDNDDRVVEVMNSDSASGIRIDGPETSQLINSKHEPIKIRRCLVENARDSMKFYVPEEDDQGEDPDFPNRSDLTPQLIQKATQAWEMWDEMDNSSSDDNLGE